MVLGSRRIGETSLINQSSRAGLQYKNKTMGNEKAKRIRNAHRAFVEKMMEGATRLLVQQTADHVKDSSREKIYGIEINHEWKARNHPKAGRNNSGKH